MINSSSERLHFNQRSKQNSITSQHFIYLLLVPLGFFHLMYSQNLSKMRTPRSVVDIYKILFSSTQPTWKIGDNKINTWNFQLKPCLTEGYDHVGVKAGSTAMGRKRVGSIKGGWSSITAGSTWFFGCACLLCFERRDKQRWEGRGRQTMVKVILLGNYIILVYYVYGQYWYCHYCHVILTRIIVIIIGIIIYHSYHFI